MWKYFTLLILFSFSSYSNEFELEAQFRMLNIFKLDESDNYYECEEFCKYNYHSFLFNYEKEDQNFAISIGNRMFMVEARGLYNYKSSKRISLEISVRNLHYDDSFPPPRKRIFLLKKILKIFFGETTALRFKIN